MVRISGPAARLALERLAGSVPLPRRASLRRIRNGAGETIDRGVILFFEGPGTVTGEDLAEIHLHGGRAVVAACLDALVSLPGIRLAEAGEFTRRAFENGRLDLTEAEGLADLLAAETEAQRAQAVEQSGGALRRLYEGWMTRLLHARAMLEASFDFADEDDVGEEVAAAVGPALRRLAAEMRAHLADAHRGEILRHGYRVAIAGPPNAGKSSLLNALADREAAIVSAVPGTTRDVIEVVLDLGGVPVRLCDTAGLRETTDAVETIGIERAMAAMAAADLILLLSEDGAFPVGTREEQQRQTLRIRTKSDLEEVALEDLAPEEGLPERFASGTFDFAVSTQTGEGLDRLVSRLGELARGAAGDPSQVLPMRSRHREIVADALDLIQSVPDADGPPEIAAEALRRAGDRLGALTGRVGVEDLLDVIFSQFCIGK